MLLLDNNLPSTYRAETVKCNASNRGNLLLAAPIRRHVQTGAPAQILPMQVIHLPHSAHEHPKRSSFLQGD